MESNTTATVSSNIRKLTVIKFFQSCAIMMPMITLFYQDNGLSLSQIFLLQSVFAIAVFVFEVPTGYFGDRVGKKASIVRGVILFGIGYLTYSAGINFYQFAISEIIIALGVALISGSDSALTYETLKTLGKQDEYKKTEGKIQFVGETTAALGGILGGLIVYYYSLRTSMFLQGIIIASAIPFALSLVDIVSDKKSSDTSLRKNIWDIITYSLYHNKKLKWIIAYTGILSTASLCMVRAAQPYLKLIGVPIVRFGVARFFLRGCVSISGLFAHAWDKKFGLQWGLLGLLGFGVAGYLVSGLNPYIGNNVVIGTIIGLFGLSLLHIQRGLQKPISNHAINELADSHVRATVLSVNSMIGRLGYAILGPIIGRLGDLYDVQTMLILSAGIFGILGLLAFYKLFHSQRTQIAQ